MVFLHQFAFEDRGSFVCNHDGQPLALVASGVQNGLHWAVFQIAAGQPWIELRINKPQAEIIHCQNQVRKVLWRGTIYKDNQNPPRQFFAFFRAAIATLLCHSRQCPGFHNFASKQPSLEPQEEPEKVPSKKAVKVEPTRPLKVQPAKPKEPTKIVKEVIKKTPEKGEIFKAEKKEEKKATKTSETLKIKKR